MRFTSLLVAALIVASPGHAQAGRSDRACSSQILAAVIGGMPPGTRELDPRRLSCLGLTQVYFIQTSSLNDRDYAERQRIEAVFRREGLAP